jgi:hypothetical protein
MVCGPISRMRESWSSVGGPVELRTLIRRAVVAGGSYD